MKNGTGRVTCVCILMIVMAAIGVDAETQQPQDSRKPAPLKAPDDIGLIFNTTNILLNLESYQAGLGAKIGWDNLYVRALFDLVANGAANTFAVNAGATIEYHLNPGPLSFYVGGSIVGGYMRQENLISATHLSLSAIAGVEYFPLEFISFFAEYALAADFTITKDLQSSQTTFDYLFNTRMGNDSKLGIVIYLMRAFKKQ